MFTADNVEVKVSKYQGAGVNEKVVISEIQLVELATGKKVIEMKTLNENSQEGKSKRLYLDTTISEGRQASAWTVSAKYLINLIMSSTGKSADDAKAVLKADNETSLVNSLNNAILGKPFRGLFSSKEYQPGKFAIELYGTEPVGGTRLVFDPSNRFMNSVLPKVDAQSDGMPF
jgi:hypothetical protein